MMSPLDLTQGTHIQTGRHHPRFVGNLSFEILGSEPGRKPHEMHSFAAHLTVFHQTASDVRMIRYHYATCNALVAPYFICTV